MSRLLPSVARALALSTLLITLALPALPGAQAQVPPDCDQDPVVCWEIVYDWCFDYPVGHCYVEPVPACIIVEVHPPKPLPGWGGFTYCWFT